MTTTIQARPRQFVHTPSIDRVAKRALRYLQSGYSVHLRGPAGVGKTTLALHLADLLSRPIMLLFGDDEFKTSDLIGNQSGFTRKKVFDNFIHSVVKMEDEVRQNWVDSRLTLACREGFTLVYDEFNRSRPEVNNVLLSALEEKLLVLPPNSSRSEYIRVNPNFRAIFTSNPVEYCGVHSTQDALLDRLITINMPEPDELTQHEILVQKTEIDRESAVFIVQLVSAFRRQTSAKDSSGLRSCLMIAKICKEHDVIASPGDADFRELCQDVLLSRANQSIAESTQLLWDTFNRYTQGGSFLENEATDAQETSAPPIEQRHENPEGQPDIDESSPVEEELTSAEPGQDAAALDAVQLTTDVWDSGNQREDESIALSPEPATVSSNHLSSAIFLDDQSDDQSPLDTGAPESLSQPLSETPAPDGQVEDAASSDSPDLLRALEVDIPEAAKEVAMQFESLPEDDDASIEDFTSDVSTDSADEVIEEHPAAIVDDSPAPSISMPETDTSHSDDVGQQIVEAPIQPVEGDNSGNNAAVQLDAGSTESSSPVQSMLNSPQENARVPFEKEVYQYLKASNDARPSQIESALGISRFQTVNALRSLADRGLINLRSHPTSRGQHITQQSKADQSDFTSGYHSGPATHPSISPTGSTHLNFQPRMMGGELI